MYLYNQICIKYDIEYYNNITITDIEYPLYNNGNIFFNIGEF